MMRRAGKWRNGIRMMAALCLLALPLRAHAQCTLPSDGLIGHWTLDETSGTTANALVGPNGTLNNGMTAGTATTAGKVATGLQFDGTNDYIGVPNFAGVNNLAAMTLSGWFKADTLTGVTQRLIHTPSNNFALYINVGNEISFEVFASGNGYKYAEANTGIQPGVWYHVTAVYENGETLKIYRDGQHRTTWTDIAPVGLINTDSPNIEMGYNAGGANNPFDGALDDVRIYNRVLSDSEIAALYATRSTAAAPAGYMTYDAKHARMMYCNGTDWVHAGIGAYNPNAVSFDGASDILAGTPMSAGASTDTDKVTASFWVMPAAETTQVLWQGSSVGRIQIMVNDDATPANGLVEIYFHGRNSSDNGIISVGSNPISTNSWHHVLISLDAANNINHLYVDGVLSEQGEAIIPANGSIDFDTQHNISTGGAYLNASVADFWLDVGRYIDFSVEANRHKFRTPTGMPMYLGADGSLPTGTAPDIFLTGNTDTWHTNKGTGGGFTETGALSTAASQPGSALVTHGDIATGLVAYWDLNESGSTTTAQDSSTTGANGTLLNFASPSAAWQSARIDGGLDFAGDNDVIDIAGSSGVGHALDFTSGSFSIAVWAKPDAPNGSLVTKRSDAGDQYQLMLGATPKLTFRAGGEWGSSTTTIPLGVWSHLAVSVNASGTPELYVNGVKETWVNETGTRPFAFNHNNVNVSLGGRYATYPTPAFLYNGLLDDVRIYNRALTDADMKLLYNCTAPAGALKYDSGFNVMSYCNGAEWVPMGPVGGTPPESGMVGHWKFDEGSGSTTADSSATGAVGTLTNGAAWGTGLVSSALSFDGVDSYISVPYDSDFYGQSALTVTGWFKLNSFASPQMMLTDAWGGTYALYFSTPNRLSFDHYPTGGYRYADAIIPTSGDWVFFAAQWESGIRAKIYINGIESTTYVDPTASTGTISDNGQGLEFGYNTGGGNMPLDGLLDDIRVYNRVLSTTEIQKLYHYGRSRGVGDVSGNCANPAKPEGSMVFNADHNVMQYCNGEQWIGIGQ